MTDGWHTQMFLAQVADRGEYRSVSPGHRAARVVLALLGAHLSGRVRARLAAQLPQEFALILLNPLPAAEPLDQRLARATAAWIEGATETTALWDIGCCRWSPTRPARI